MTFNEMLSTYDRLAYAHHYIFGFEKDGEIFATTCTAEILPSVCYLDRASRGQGSAIRFRPNREQKALLASQPTTFRLCSAESLEKAKAESKYNRGEIFEKFDRVLRARMEERPHPLHRGRRHRSERHPLPRQVH